MNPVKLRQFRQIALFEGLSFLVLLGIAMPLKYLADLPLAVRIVGLLHGLLFLAYGGYVLGFLSRNEWSLGRAAVAMFWSLVPFGTFVLDRSLAREIEEPQPGS